MSNLHLYDAGDPVWQGVDTGGAHTYEISTQFTVTAACQVAELRWYRIGTGAGFKPEALRLWDTGPHSQIATAPSVPDDGTVGWQTAVIDPPVNLTNGQVYRVSAYWPTGSSFAHGASTPVPAAPSPLAWSGNHRVYNVDAGPAFPEAFGDALFANLDVGVVGAAAPGGGAGGTVDLAPWLSADNAVQQHQLDGLPWLTKVKLDATALVSAAIKNSLDIISPQIGSIWALAGNLTDLELLAIRSFWKAGADRLTGPNGGGGSAFYTGSGTLTSDVIVANQDTLTFLRRPLDDFPTSYTLVDERDYTGAIIWTVEADVFVHQITAWPDTASSEDVAGRTKLPYAGWWAPQAVSLPQARRFLEFDQQLCEWLPRRMKGGIFHLKDGYTGHVQALTHV